MGYAHSGRRRLTGKRTVPKRPGYGIDTAHLKVVVWGNAIVRELVLRSSLRLCQEGILAPRVIVLEGGPMETAVACKPNLLHTTFKHSSRQEYVTGSAAIV